MKKLFVVLSLVFALLLIACGGQSPIQQQQDPVFEVTSEIHYNTGIVVVQRYESDDAEALAQRYYEAEASGCSNYFWTENGVLDLWTSGSSMCYEKIIAPNLPKRGVGEWAVLPIGDTWKLVPMASPYTDGSPGGSDVETGRFDLARVWIKATQMGCSPQLIDQFTIQIDQDSAPNLCSEIEKF